MSETPRLPIWSTQLMQIPFLKAHGAKNDFLLTSASDVPAGVPHADLARAICDRHTGIGADGWLVLGEMNDAQRSRLSQLERQRRLDDETLTSAVLAVRLSGRDNWK